MQLVLEFAFEW